MELTTITHLTCNIWNTYNKPRLFQKQARLNSENNARAYEKLTGVMLCIL